MTSVVALGFAVAAAQLADILRKAKNGKFQNSKGKRRQMDLPKCFFKVYHLFSGRATMHSNFVASFRTKKFSIMAAFFWRCQCNEATIGHSNVLYSMCVASRDSRADPPNVIKGIALSYGMTSYTSLIFCDTHVVWHSSRRWQRPTSKLRNAPAPRTRAG